MPLTDLLEPPTTADRPEGITCDGYVRGEGKRCRHYQPNGACSLPGEFMCVEWLKKNGHRPPAPATDLFGNSLPPEPPAGKPSKSRTPAAGSPASGVAPASLEPTPIPLPGPTSDDIESFKALGVEVCVRSGDFGDLWLVPAYTDRHRKEITPEHLATIARVLAVFPGSRVVALDKQQPAMPANEGSPA